MAKKKKNTTSLIVTAAIVLLSVLTICTLFMPVFKGVTSSGLLDKSSSSTLFSGSDIFVACFNGEVNSDLSTGANYLISLKGSEEVGFLANVFSWAYLLIVIANAAVLVVTLLAFLGFRLKKTQLLLGMITVILSLVAFIFGLILPGKMGGLDLGIIAKASVNASWTVYLLLASLVSGCAAVYAAKK